MKTLLKRWLWVSIPVSLTLLMGCRVGFLDLWNKSPLHPGLSHQLEEDQILRCLAQITASLQTSAVFREWLEQEVKKEPGHERSLLFLAYKDHLFPSGLSLIDLYHQEAHSLGFKVKKSFWKQLLARMPLLSIGLYLPDHINLKSWTYAHPLAVLPLSTAFEFEEKKEEWAFNLDGIIQPVSHEMPPSTALLLIKNEYSFLHLNKWANRKNIRAFFRQHWELELCKDFLDFFCSQLLRPSSPLILYRDAEHLILDAWMIREAFNEWGEGKKDDPTGKKKSGEMLSIRLRHADLNQFCRWWKTSCCIELQHPSLPSSFINGKRKEMNHGQLYSCYLPIDGGSLPAGEANTLAFIGRDYRQGSASSIQLTIRPEASFLWQELAAQHRPNSSCINPAYQNDQQQD